MTDNITIAQEVIRSLQKRKCHNGDLILKVDLKNAYDQVDWGFSDEVLKATLVLTQL